MKLKELLTIIQGTQIQKEAAIKNCIGSNIEIHTDIANIDNTRIVVYWNNFGIEEGRISEGFIDIQYEKAKFGTQLLSYSSDDRVMIIAKLREANFSSYPDSYQFDLVSIRKLSTRVEREKAEEAEREERRKAEEEEERSKRNAAIASEFWVIYFAYLVPVLVLGTALIWHSLTTGESVRLRWDWITFLVPLLNWLILIVILLLSSTDRAICFVLLVVFLALGAVLRLATVKD